MDSTRTSSGPFEALSARERSSLVWSAAGLTLIAWAGVVLVHSRHAHATPALHGWPPAPLGLVLATLIWFGMMVAMMTPAVWPWLPWLASATKSRGAGGPLSGVGVFLAGYFAIWGGFSVAAAALQLALQGHAWLQTPDLRLSALPGALVLLAAGAYQFTPLKAACLQRCRSPVGFFLSHWRSGPTGGFAMGFRHGVYCLGCCWALMLVAFALGVVDLLWMAVITGVIATEQALPGGKAIGRGVGVVMVGAGLWMLAAGL